MSERFPKCFTLTCDNLTISPKWFCPDCEAVMELLAMRDKERAAEKSAAAAVAKAKARRTRSRQTHAKALSR
jgi:hypothetical protein